MNTILLHNFVLSLSSFTKRGKIQERCGKEMRRAEIDPHPRPSGAVSKQLNVCAPEGESDLEFKLP